MSEYVPVSEVVPKKSKYPRSIPFIIGNEAAERFSFYGMRSILVTFLVAQFYNPTHNPALTTVAEARANESTHFFVALAYSLPFVGGLVADWFTGKYKIILYISIVYCLGHLFLALFDTNLNGFTIGLILVAIGAGGIKSCVSANVGDQFDASNQDLLDKVYGWFYFSINAGSMIATVMIPWTYETYGAKWALFNLSKKKKGESWLDVAKTNYDPIKVEGIKAVYRVMAVFFFALAFWAVWDQNLSEWVLQAAKMNRTLYIGSFHFTMLPGQVQTFNPVFLLIFIPLFSYWLYPYLDSIGLKTTPLRRLGAGLVLTALSFVIIALIQTNIDNGGHPTIWWQIFAYVILSAAEVLVSITGLEYAYTHSPKSMKSTMTAIWLLVVALGNTITAMVNGNISSGGFLSHRLQGANYYWFFVWFITVFVVVFMFVSPRLKERSYILDPDQEPIPVERSKIIADTNNL